MRLAAPASNVLEVPISRVAEALGIEVMDKGGRLYCRCPYAHHEHDDASPACHLGGNVNLCTCFKCNTSKDNIGLVMAVRHCDARDAAAWLRETFRLSGPKRAFTGSPDPIEMLAHFRGWKLEAFKALGAKATGENVSIPMRDADGNTVGHKLRKGNNQAFTVRDRPVKSYTPFRDKHGLFYPAKGLLKTGAVLLVEGEADTLAALSADARNVVGTSGVNPGAIGREALQQMLSGHTCILFPDPDAAGRKWLREMGGLLANVQCDVRYVPASKYDLDNRLKNEKHPVKALARLVERAIRWIAPDVEAGLPEIYLNDFILDSLTRQAVEALDAKNDPPVLFVRSGKLCRVIRDEKNYLKIDFMDKPKTRHRLSEVARFIYITKQSEAYRTPHEHIVESVLVLSSWPFPALEGVTGAPVLRPNGTICIAPGYDDETKIYYLPPEGFEMPPVPETPTKKERAAAKDLLLDIMADFPFDEEASLANALSILFSILMRPVISGNIPLCLIEAPVQGSGKTLLPTMLSIIAIGEISVQSAPNKARDDEEWRKRITSVLRKGSPVVLLDNLSERSVLDSQDLAALLTSATWEDRILGQTEMIHFAARTIWICTGNNIRITGDMPRRCYTVRIDANCERPWERSPENFRHPELERYVRENRGRLLAAAFTLVRAWYCDGSPEPKNVPTMGSFIEWSKVVGGVLEHAGIEGFLQNLHRTHGIQDEEMSQWAAFFEAWWSTWEDGSVSTADVANALLDSESNLSTFLPDSLLPAKDKGIGSLKRSLGIRLSRLSGRIYEKRKLHSRKDKHTKSKVWQLCYTEDAEKGEDDGLRSLRSVAESFQADVAKEKHTIPENAKMGRRDEVKKIPQDPQDPAKDTAKAENETLFTKPTPKKIPQDTADTASEKSLLSEPTPKKIPQDTADTAKGKSVPSEPTPKKIPQDTAKAKSPTVLSPCDVCGNTRFWKTLGGQVMCGKCYPPENEEMVAKWIDVKGEGDGEPDTTGDM